MLLLVVVFCSKSKLLYAELARSLWGFSTCVNVVLLLFMLEREKGKTKKEKWFNPLRGLVKKMMWRRMRKNNGSNREAVEHDRQASMAVAEFTACE